MDQYLQETPMLSYSAPAIKELVASCSWRACDIPCRIHGFTIDFNRSNTYIQSEGINQDFGIYDSPDDLLREHGQEMSPFKAFVYRNIGRHLMNRNVANVRA